MLDWSWLGGTGLVVSGLCLGCMAFGRESDEEGSREIIARFLEAGGDFIDTADVYASGRSEEITGRAMEGVSRDDVVLATKVRFPMGDGPNDAGLSHKHILAGCEASLGRLGTDHIDLYPVHVWSLMHDIFDALEGERREMFTADLERSLYPGEFVTELRATAQLVEGFCIAAEALNLTSFLAMNDCRERVRRALDLAKRQAAGLE